MLMSIGKKAAWRFRRWYSRCSFSWAALRHTKLPRPLFGFGRGLCIDRYFIERFLNGNAPTIAGRVLEIGDSEYTRRFGGDRVAQSDVLHAVEGNPAATIVGDLVSGSGIPEESFDCIILTQTLPFVTDVGAAIETVWSSLRPGGVVLASVPGISPISRYDADRWGDFWRFTPQGVAASFSAVFGSQNVEVESYGNVVLATAILQGLVVHEMRPEELTFNDPDFPVVICCRAVKCVS